jgi:hypothetical protein
LEQGEVSQKWPEWRNFGGSGAESRTVGVIRRENSFTFTQKGIEITKVAACRDQKRDPGLVVKGLGKDSWVGNV